MMPVTLPFVVEAPGILQYRLHSLGDHLNILFESLPQDGRQHEPIADELRRRGFLVNAKRVLA
jgi:hypothetical protein